MKKLNVFAAVASAATLVACSSFAADMEKCMVMDKEGKGLIKAGMSDCKTSMNSCAGQNKAGEAEAWITVPMGECMKINAGDFSGVDQSVKDKIMMSQ
jgi:uncharacterized membrane protein